MQRSRRIFMSLRCAKSRRSCASAHPRQTGSDGGSQRGTIRFFGGPTIAQWWRGLRRPSRRFSLALTRRRRPRSVQRASMPWGTGRRWTSRNSSPEQRADVPDRRHVAQTRSRAAFRMTRQHNPAAELPSNGHIEPPGFVRISHGVSNGTCHPRQGTEQDFR